MFSFLYISPFNTLTLLAKETIDDEKKYYGCRLLIEIPIKKIKQWGNNEIKLFLYNLDYLSDTLSAKNYKYLPIDKTVQESFNNAKQFMNELNYIELYERREFISNIVSELLLLNNNNQNKIKSDVDFIKNFPVNNTFIHTFQIFLSNNNDNINLIKQINSYSLEQLKEIYKNIRFNNIKWLFGKLNNNKDSKQKMQRRRCIQK